MAMNFRTLDLNLLRVFDHVMVERHVTRAADKLAMTQPAVSNALRRLREAIGDELFVPGPTGVTPTRRAEAMWPAVREALRLLQAEFEPAAFDPTRDDSEFSVAMADATAAVLMPVVMDQWQRAGVRCRLSVVSLDTRDPRPMLEQGEADLAVGFFPEVAHDLATGDSRGPARLDPLYECAYVAVMRRGHPLDAAGSPDLDAYCNARHLRVDFAGRPRGYVDESLSRLGRSRNVVLTVDHFSTASCVVGHSDLITVLPRSFVQATDIGAALSCRPLPFELPRIDVGLLWHRRHESDEARRWLRESLKRAGAVVAQRTRAAAGSEA
jgi:DNA-binding transcriptional LysR family regulator